jgi:hypothetical protein
MGVMCLIVDNLCRVDSIDEDGTIRLLMMIHPLMFVICSRP